MAKEEKRMDHGFSVFNGHVNSGAERAKAEFIEQFGQKMWDKHIQPFDDEGIMSIFHKRPGKYQLVYVALVTAYVNEDREPLKELLTETYLKGWEQSAEGANHEYHDADTEKSINRKAKAWARRQIEKLRYPKD